MTEYIVAVKRECRAQADPDWVRTLHDVPGVEVTASSAARRATVRATAAGVHELEARVGAFCHIEPVIVHGTHLPPSGTTAGATTAASVPARRAAAGSRRR